MKRFVAVGLATIALVLATEGTSFAKGKSSFGSTSSRSSSVYVRGHTTKSGTYVPSHRRTYADSTQRNNWSSKPNVNPYTGKLGTKTPRY